MNLPDIDYGFVAQGTCPRCGKTTFASPPNVCSACREELERMTQEKASSLPGSHAYHSRDTVD